MVEALAWGAVAAASLLIGALVGLARPWPPRAIGLVLGFGAGALITTLGFAVAASMSGIG